MLPCDGGDIVGAVGTDVPPPTAEEPPPPEVAPNLVLAIFATFTAPAIPTPTAVATVLLPIKQ